MHYLVFENSWRVDVQLLAGPMRDLLADTIR